MQGYASKRVVGGRRRFRRLSHILDMVLQELNEKKVSIQDGVAVRNWKSLEEVGLISFGDDCRK